MIVATFDVTGGWTFDGDPALDFGLRFTDGDADRIEPDRLTFGWALTVDGDDAGSHVWPPSNIVIRQLTRQRVFPFRADAAADAEVTLTVWASESGTQVDAVHTFVIPRPAQPYPSWTWVDGAWAAPVAYPDGDGMYGWDEDAGDWTAVESSDG